MCIRDSFPGAPGLQNRIRIASGPVGGPMGLKIKSEGPQGVVARRLASRSLEHVAARTGRAAEPPGPPPAFQGQAKELFVQQHK
eukprot:8898340-Alexandrium_andersonii.AAC.1